MGRVLVGVTGGIAAYKACELVRLLVKDGNDVVPLVTRGADRFVRARTFEALARRAPREDAYPHLTKPDDYMGGIDLYRRAGFAEVRPANKRAIVRREFYAPLVQGEGPLVMLERGVVFVDGGLLPRCSRTRMPGYVSLIPHTESSTGLGMTEYML